MEKSPKVGSARHAKLPIINKLKMAEILHYRAIGDGQRKIVPLPPEGEFPD
jgi:hypothetical protein